MPRQPSPVARILRLPGPGGQGSAASGAVPAVGVAGAVVDVRIFTLLTFYGNDGGISLLPRCMVAVLDPDKRAL